MVWTWVLSYFSRVQLCVTLWTIAHKDPLSMGFFRQEYWSGLLSPLTGDLPHPSWRWGYLNQLSGNKGWVFRVTFGDYINSNFAPHKLFIPGRQVYLLFGQHSSYSLVCSVKRPKLCHHREHVLSKVLGDLCQETHVHTCAPSTSISKGPSAPSFPHHNSGSSYSLFSPAEIDLSLPWLFMDSLSTLFTLTLEVALAVKNPPASAGDMRHGFNPWVRKIRWRRAWQPIPVFLSVESHGQRSLAGYSPWS